MPHSQEGLTPLGQTGRDPGQYARSDVDGTLGYLRVPSNAR